MKKLNELKIIESKRITDAVATLCMDACCIIDSSTLCALKRGRDNEKSPLSIDVLNRILENADIASSKRIPACQDCGTAVVFAEIGQDIHIDGDFENAVSEGVEKGYCEGYLRKSICDPFTRANTGNNLPCIIHTRLVPGNHLRLTVVPKGGGAENVSALKMMLPSAGKDGVMNFVEDVVKKAGPNPCPPMTIGIGIGGNFETAPLLAKEALIRGCDDYNPNPEIREMEEALLYRLNQLDIGPGGFGGRTSVLAVHISVMPCHIASLPCAVNINCHSSRHRSIVL